MSSLRLPPVARSRYGCLGDVRGRAPEPGLADQPGELPHLQLVVRVLRRGQGGERAEPAGQQVFGHQPAGVRRIGEHPRQQVPGGRTGPHVHHRHAPLAPPAGRAGGSPARRSRRSGPRAHCLRRRVSCANSSMIDTHPALPRTAGCRRRSPSAACTATGGPASGPRGGAAGPRSVSGSLLFFPETIIGAVTLIRRPSRVQGGRGARSPAHPGPGRRQVGLIPIEVPAWSRRPASRAARPACCCLRLLGTAAAGRQAAEGVHPGRAVEHAGARERLDVRLAGRRPEDGPAAQGDARPGRQAEGVREGVDLVGRLPRRRLLGFERAEGQTDGRVRRPGRTRSARSSRSASRWRSGWASRSSSSRPRGAGGACTPTSARRAPGRTRWNDFTWPSGRSGASTWRRRRPRRSQERRACSTAT